MGLFNLVAETVGVPIEQVTFLSTQIVSLFLAVLFRTKLSPSYTSSSTRHIVGACFGLVLLYWCYGWYLLHMVAQCMGVYALMVLLPHHINYKMALVYGMSYLTYIQITRIQGMPGFSSPVMFSTTKLVGMAFSIHDGVHKKWETLSQYQKKYAIKKYPSLVEMFGFVFHFSGVICGPTFFYQEYAEFITGENYLCKDQVKIQNNNSNGVTDHHHHTSEIQSKYQEINPTSTILKKLLISFVCLLITLLICPIFPSDVIGEWSFIQSHGFLYRNLYVDITFMITRYRFYFAWVLGEAIQNASGLGLHYVDSIPQWDLTTNVNIWKLEMPTSLKDIMDNWHISAGKWLRLVAYERTGKFGVVSTFALSALWHGLAPGYYVTALTVAFFTIAARKVRRVVRPHIIDTKWKKPYDVLTGISACCALYYSLGGYHVLTLELTLRYFTYCVCWWLHLAALLIILVPVPAWMIKKREKLT